MSDSLEKTLELGAAAAKLLGHPARISILQLLARQGSCTPAEIFASIPLSRGSVNQHLTALKDAAWIQSVLQGSQIHYVLQTTQMHQSLAVLIQAIAPLQQVQTPPSPAVQPVPVQQILFLCTGNSCRSQMAEGFFNQLMNAKGWKAISAGTVPAAQIHPLARTVMQELYVDLQDQYPKSIDAVLGQSSISMVIFVCSDAEENCPYLFPYAQRTIKMPFEDPAVFQGSDEEKLVKFRQVRDQIQTKIQTLVGELNQGVVHG